MSKYNIDNLYFKDIEHKKRLLELLLKDNTNPKDIERLSLFYIVASDLDIYNKFNKFFYNFKDHCIVSEGFGEVDLSSSQRKFIYLGFNLYNDFYDDKENITIFNMFSGLDSDNFRVAIESIKLRFNKI